VLESGPFLAGDEKIPPSSERKPTYSILPPPDDIIPTPGVLYKATFASREKGEKLAKQLGGTIVQIGRQELGSLQKLCTIFEHLKGGDDIGL